MKLIFTILLILNSTKAEIFPDLNKILLENNISSVLIFYEENLPEIKIEIPKIIFSINDLPFNHERSRNRNTFSIIYMESLYLLDRISDHFQYNLESNLLIVSKILPEKIFKRCYELDFPNIILKYKNSFYSYCFKYPIYEFEISLNNFMKKKWYNQFLDYDCKWNLEITSRKGKPGSMESLISFISSRLNADLNITIPETMSNRSIVMADFKKVNESSYKISNLYIFNSIVLIIPVRSYNLKLFYLKPFDIFTWIVFIGSIFYFAFILGILSKLI